MSTAAQYLKHAQKFGTDCVMDTALRDDLTVDELRSLRVELDRMDRTRTSGGFTVGKARRRSPVETMTAVADLHEAGRLPKVIADQLGVGVPYVRRILKQLDAIQVVPADHLFRSQYGGARMLVNRG